MVELLTHGVPLLMYFVQAERVEDRIPDERRAMVPDFVYNGHYPGLVVFTRMWWWN